MKRNTQAHMEQPTDPESQEDKKNGDGENVTKRIEVKK